MGSKTFVDAVHLLLERKDDEARAVILCDTSVANEKSNHPKLGPAASYSTTLLGVAIYLGRPKIVELLIELGADIDLKTQVYAVSRTPTLLVPRGIPQQDMVVTRVDWPNALFCHQLDTNGNCLGPESGCPVDVNFPESGRCVCFYFMIWD